MIACAVAEARAQAMPASLTQFLQQTVGLKQEEMAEAARGKAVVKALDTPDHREVAVFGVVRIEVPRSFFVQRAADFPTSLRTPARLHFAIFSDPVAPA